jgi:hypothetical protein
MRRVSTHGRKIGHMTQVENSLAKITGAPHPEATIVRVIRVEAYADEITCIAIPIESGATARHTPAGHIRRVFASILR